MVPTKVYSRVRDGAIERLFTLNVSFRFTLRVFTSLKLLNKYLLLYKSILVRFYFKGAFVSISKNPFGIRSLYAIH